MGGQDHRRQRQRLLRLCRVGETVTAYISDGGPWQQVLSAERPDLGGTVYVGPVSHAWASPANLQARYDAVTFEAVTGPDGCLD